ncbi:MAG: DUF4037 domain-containing protein [Halobacteriaceae archaeon]
MQTLKRLQDIARSIANELSERDNVSAVLLVGSASLGFADDTSDIDLEVVGSIEPGEQNVEDVHIEWSTVSAEEIEEALARWEDDAALYTYANADILYDDGVNIANQLMKYRQYPSEVYEQKVFAGWFYGTADLFDATKARKRGQDRVKLSACVSAVEQFVSLTYVLNRQFPPYRKWLFHEIPEDIPAIDDALKGDIHSLEKIKDAVKGEVNEVLDDAKFENPYLYDPKCDRLG